MSSLKRLIAYAKAWRSLVAHLTGGQGVAGSNPVSPTMPTIKSFTKEAFELERLAKDSQAYQLANEDAIVLSSAFIPIIRMAIVAGFIATLILGGHLTLNGTLAIASYSVLVFLTQRLLWPFTRLAEMTDLYQRAMASADRVLDLLETPITISDGQKEVEFSKEIAFKDVSFAYNNGKLVFSNLNFAIKKGQTVAIVGSTGTGKSTIIKLLMRYYQPISGQILIDGIDIKDLRIRSLRKAISFVSQDVFLFSGTIKENIAYGQDNATDAEIVAAAKVAEIHNFIITLPEGYDSQVGERGIKLSGGQAQRISIARAVLKNSPIFIFDEATSAVDNETEEAIQRSLQKIVIGRSSIVIAHRLSTIRHADVIFVMDQGKVTERGTHEELCQRQGIYARLWHIQTGSKNDSLIKATQELV
jgi:ATP-binding cassette subfamily B protein